MNIFFFYLYIYGSEKLVRHLLTSAPALSSPWKNKGGFYINRYLKSNGICFIVLTLAKQENKSSLDEDEQWAAQSLMVGYSSPGVFYAGLAN